MIIIVDDKRDKVSFCWMEIGQFFKIAAVVNFARTKPGIIGEQARELSNKCHWILHSHGDKMSLVSLTWEQVFTLSAALEALGLGARKSMEFLDAAINAAI